MGKGLLRVLLLWSGGSGKPCLPEETKKGEKGSPASPSVPGIRAYTLVRFHAAAPVLTPPLRSTIIESDWAGRNPPYGKLRAQRRTGLGIEDVERRHVTASVRPVTQNRRAAPGPATRFRRVVSSTGNMDIHIGTIEATENGRRVGTVLRIGKRTHPLYVRRDDTVLPSDSGAFLVFALLPRRTSSDASRPGGCQWVEMSMMAVKGRGWGWEKVEVGGYPPIYSPLFARYSEEGMRL